MKLMTDIGSSLISLCFFWRHDLTSGLLVDIAPGVAVSSVMMRCPRRIEHPCNQFDFLDRSAMSRMIPDFSTVSVHTEHADYLAILLEIDCVVTVGFMMWSSCLMQESE
jgi:hypothetical protein